MVAVTLLCVPCCWAQLAALTPLDIGTAGGLPSSYASLGTPQIPDLTRVSCVGEQIEYNFNFLHTEVTGDFDVRVNLRGGNSALSPNGQRYAFGGLVARAGLHQLSPYFFSGVALSNSVGTYWWLTSYRSTQGGNGQSLSYPDRDPQVFPNAWLRIQRVGNRLRSFYSTNGNNWIDNNGGHVVSNNWPNTLYVGIASCGYGGKAGPPASTFDYGNFSLTSTNLTLPSLLRLVRNTNSMQLEWSGGGTLQLSTNASGPYYDVPGAASPYPVSASSKEKFYRLRNSGVSAFVELPPELPRPASAQRGKDWSENAIVIQPWGYTQPQMVTPVRPQLPQSLKETYGFNTLCVMPPPALAAVGGGHQSEANFTNALAVYRAAGYKIILYTALVNMGHDPAWDYILVDHPEWKQVDSQGAGTGWLCPNNEGVLNLAINYTRDIVQRYGADGLLLDNNGFLATPSGKPACYCSGCRTGFRQYIANRFGPLSEVFFGLPSNQIEIPTLPGILYNVWKEWRGWSWVETMERTRSELPGVVIFANTQFWYWTSGASGWILGHDKLYRHQDLVLSESYFMNPREVSSKMILGRALATPTPLFDLVGTFEWNSPAFTPLKPASVISRLTGAALLHAANPWLGYYAMEGDDATNAASRNALSRLLLLRSNHPEFYTNLTVLSPVGSVLPLQSYNSLGVQYPALPPFVNTLSDLGVPTTGVCDQNLGSTELSRLRYLTAEFAVCMDSAACSNIAQWIQNGGVLVTTPDLATYDEIGRPRPRSKLADALGMAGLSTKSVGAGMVHVVPSGEVANKMVQLQPDRIEASGVAQNSVQVVPYKTPEGRTIVHLLNYASTLNNAWTIKLPAYVMTNVANVTLYEPGDAPLALPWSGQQIQMPPIDAYSVIEVSHDQ